MLSQESTEPTPEEMYLASNSKTYLQRYVEDYLGLKETDSESPDDDTEARVMASFLGAVQHLLLSLEKHEDVIEKRFPDIYEHWQNTEDFFVAAVAYALEHHHGRKTRI